MTRRTRAVVLRCGPGKTCDFHRDGGPEVERCPGVCDARDCAADGRYEVSTTGRNLCALHAAIVLLARAISEALAGDNAEGGA